MRFRVHIRPPSVHAEAHPLDGEKARIRRGGAKFKASKQAAKLRGHQADACSQYCGASGGKLGLYMARGAIKIECAIYCSILIQYWLKFHRKLEKFCSVEDREDFKVNQCFFLEIFQTGYG